MSAPRSDSGSEAPRTVYRVCPLCEATCGIAVEVADDRAVSIRGDADDPFSRGYICPKAHGLIGLQEDSDRLRRPVRREGGRWIEMEWDEAFALVSERLRAVRDAHGEGAIVVDRSVGMLVSHNAAAHPFAGERTASRPAPPPSRDRAMTVPRWRPTIVSIRISSGV